MWPISLEMSPQVRQGSERTGLVDREWRSGGERQRTNAATQNSAPVILLTNAGIGEPARLHRLRPPRPARSCDGAMPREGDAMAVTEATPQRLRFAEQNVR